MTRILVVEARYYEEIADALLSGDGCAVCPAQRQVSTGS